MRVFAVRLLALNLAIFLSSFALGQVSPRILITKPVNENELMVLKGNTHPLARPEFDQGAAPNDLPMNRMLLVLKRSDEQETGLRTLIDAQQDKASPSYHKWLTPENFGKQFGPADQDIQQVTAWLQNHGFQVTNVSKGRTVIEFSGTAAQVQEALHTSIHKYAVNGEQHWANAGDPQIPEALTPVVGGVRSLNDFRPQPMLHVGGVVERSKDTGEMKPLKPLFTLPGGGCGVQRSDCYGVGPYDFATIYNLTSLWNGSPAVDGAGQTIAIVGETDINPQDVVDFRNFFGLPPLTGSQLNIIHNGPAPGILTDGEETESDLDVEWSSAVAKGATVDFVVSQSTETTAGIDLSAEYIVDNNLAPVMSESYGECELGLGTAGNSFYSRLWQQAAAEGITVFLSSGDTGSAGCSSQDSGEGVPSFFGLAVSGFASTPYNVAVGGTDFNDLTNASTYWSLSNNSTTRASALSYIPETTWNDSCTNSVFGSLPGFSSNAETNCNNGQLFPSVVTIGGSGGKSGCTTSDGQNPSSCGGGYAKPSWQSGSGVPPDGVRDIPDVSLFAASGSPSGSFYIVCEADQVSGNSCDPANPSTQFLGVGGTSASSPAFAGIMALVNQHTNSRQGNANYVFYKLAANQPGVFNDVPAGGTIAMPCQTGSPDCTTLTSGDQFGVQSGYTSGPGYDLATGLGSVNVANLVNKWNLVTFNASTTSLNNLSPNSITHGQTVNVTVKVTGSAGTPTGAISLFGGANGTQPIDTHILDGTGTAMWTTALLPGGSYSVKAHYAGDGNYGSSDSALSAVVVNKENSSAQIQLLTYNPNNGQVINPNATTVVYGSAYLLRVNVLNSASKPCAGVPNLPTGCATGSVTVTDNSSPFGAGTFSLNSLGYFENQTIQLPGGSHSLQAHYLGDNSFNASPAATDAVTITPAATNFESLESPGNIMVNQNFGVNVQVSAQSFGVAPTGTFTFTIDGAPLSGNINYTGIAPCGTSNFSVCLQGQFTTASISTGGRHLLNVIYSGDTNYSGSSDSTFINAIFTTTTTLTSSTLNPQAGAAVTLTAFVDTSTKSFVPTGNIQFVTVPGSPVVTATTDANGNSALQGTLSFTPTSNNSSVHAIYGGDSTFQTSSSDQIIIVVAGNDFLLSANLGGANAVSISPGQTGPLGIFVDGQAGYDGTIAFSATSCSGLPAESSCSFSPSSITGTGTANLLIATTAPHGLVRRAGNVGFWPAALGLSFAGILLLTPVKGRSVRNFMRTLSLGLVLIVGIGCGGGGSGGPGGSGQVQTDPGTPAGTYPITVTATSGSTTHTVKFSLIVQ